MRNLIQWEMRNFQKWWIGGTGGSGGTVGGLKLN